MKNEIIKKSFVLHNDSLEILEFLTDNEAGKLFKAIAAFNAGKKYFLSRKLELHFLPLKNQFKRDAIKYNEKSFINSFNGSLGGKGKVATGTQPNRPQTNLADNDKDTDINKEKEKEFFRSLVPFIQKYGKEMVRDFFDYHSEKNSEGKMKWELEKTWQLEKRLQRWAAKEQKFYKNNNKNNDSSEIYKGKN